MASWQPISSLTSCRMWCCFQIDRNVSIQLVARSLPQIKGDLIESVSNAIEIMAAKWFISNFIDAVPLQVQLHSAHACSMWSHATCNMQYAIDNCF